MRKTAGETSADRLLAEGFSSKGFGNVPKFVMFDTDLSLEAKGIYAYLCSFAGGGETAFPGLSKITYDLCINKDTYYKHFKLLTKNGYIRVISNTSSEAVRGRRFSNNVYVLVSSPEKYTSSLSSENSPRLRYTGLKASGYGQVNKAVMTMQGLSIKAKAMYAYYAAYTGAGESAFPKQDVILYHTGISRNSLNKYNNELIDASVLSIVQRKVNGTFSVNDYCLCDTEKITPMHKFSETENSEPQLKISETEKPETEKPQPKISETNNNSIKNNRIYNKQSSKLSEADKEGGTEDLFLEDFRKNAVFDPSWSKDEASDALKLLLDFPRFSDPSNYERFEDGQIMRNTFMLFYET